MINLIFCIFASLFLNLADASDVDFLPSPQSYIGVGGGYDSDKNQDINIYLDIESAEYQHIGFSYSRNKSSLENALTVNYGLSAGTSSYETISLDANFNYMQLSDAMESTIFSSAFNLNLDNWLLSLSPQLNTMTFYLNSDKKNKFDIFAKGAEISASYYGVENHYFSLSYFENDFSEKPIFLRPGAFDALVTNTINKIRIISRISELTASLEQQHISLSAGRYFNWGSINLSWSYAELFNISRWLDFSSLEEFNETNYISTYTVSSDITFNKQLSIGLSLGMQTFSTDSEQLVFTASEIIYSW